MNNVSCNNAAHILTGHVVHNLKRLSRQGKKDENRKSKGNSLFSN